jgi:hypothetical protein
VSVPEGSSSWLSGAGAGLYGGTTGGEASSSMPVSLRGVAREPGGLETGVSGRAIAMGYYTGLSMRRSEQAGTRRDPGGTLRVTGERVAGGATRRFPPGMTTREANEGTS